MIGYHNRRFLKEYFTAINNKAKYVHKRQRDILLFSWPNDIVFDKWMAEIAPDEPFGEDP